MALDYELIKSKLTVFVQTANVDVFDISTAFAVAIAQSYSLDTTADTQEVIDLADCDSDWSNPEVNKKSWTLSVDTLLLRPNLGAGTIDIEDKVDAYTLKIGDIVWAVIGDAPCVSPFSPDLTSEFKYQYGKAVITGLSQAGTQGEFQTLSASFTGKGELLKSV